MGMGSYNTVGGGQFSFTPTEIGAKKSVIYVICGTKDFEVVLM